MRKRKNTKDDFTTCHHENKVAHYKPTSSV